MGIQEEVMVNRCTFFVGCWVDDKQQLQDVLASERFVPLTFMHFRSKSPRIKCPTYLNESFFIAHCEVGRVLITS